MSNVNPTSAPSQVSYPWKATVRTAIQGFLSTAAILVIALPMVAQFIAEQFPGSPVGAWILVGAAFVGALAALVSRIMAIPGVNAALTKVGLGATPAVPEITGH